MASNSRDLAKRSAVDPEDEPSVEWGWHGSFPRGKAIGAVVSVLVLIAIAFGPYQSRTQDLWLIGIALLLVFGLVRQVMSRRNSWRR